MWNQIKPIILKEFRQIRRDRRALALLVFVPAMLLVLFGFALNFDVQNISIAIFDEDRTAESRELISDFYQSGYFNRIETDLSYSEIDKLLFLGNASIVMVIPYNFTEDIKRGESPIIQIIIDGTDPNTAGKIIGYTNGVIQDYSNNINIKEMKRAGFGKLNSPIDYRPRVWFNPELKSVKFLVPGLIGFILIITSVIATSLSIVREKEENTLIQIFSSPVKAGSLILGKTLPYLLIGLISSILILLMGYFIFDVVIKGRIFSLFVVIIIYILCGLGLGLFFSIIAETQQVAYMLSTLTTLLPSIILSGFVFPIRNMPRIIQFITYIIPARYFMTIIRDIVLKGTGFEIFYRSFVALAVITIISLSISLITLKKKGLK